MCISILLFTGIHFDSAFHLRNEEMNTLSEARELEKNNAKREEQRNIVYIKMKTVSGIKPGVKQYGMGVWRMVRGMVGWSGLA